MSTVQKIIGALLRPRVKQLARGRTIEDLAQRLEASREPVEAQVFGAADTPENREAINHLLGIERWGQSRLRVALGEPFERDSYRGYRLPDDTPLADLQAGFRDTRSGTIALARELQQAGVDPGHTVPHNDLGDLTLVEWLAYLDGHAARERFRIRQKQRSDSHEEDA
ncbi:MAG: hypothetical protein R6W77_15980 [Trueperaceae bacterium]